MVELLPSSDELPDHQGDMEELSIAFLGRPNAGKSSLVNKLVNSKRMIVDSVPGTTRDSIDTPQRWKADFGLTGKDKEASRAFASKILPACAENRKSNTALNTIRTFVQ